MQREPYQQPSSPSSETRGGDGLSRLGALIESVRAMQTRIGDAVLAKILPIDDLTWRTPPGHPGSRPSIPVQRDRKDPSRATIRDNRVGPTVG